MAINPPVDATQTPEWAALQKHYDELQVEGVSLKKWFAEDAERVEKLSFDAGDLHFDLSKNLIKPETLQLFANLAKAVKLDERTKAMYTGVHINNTEDRAVLHTALRRPVEDEGKYIVDGQDTVKDVREVLDRIYAFADKVRSGEWTGVTGKKIETVVNIGIGGSDLGPVMVYEALKPYADAGISARRITSALKALGADPTRLSAVLVTHEHTDHVSGLATLTKQLGVPVYATAPTLDRLERKVPALARLGRALEAGTGFQLGELWVESFSTPHDAAGSVGYAVTGGGARMALATDLGHLTPQVWDAARGADLLVCETNHDEDWVRSGPYPYALKQRILGDFGHLSNEAGAELAGRAALAGTRTILLAHLSSENNTPARAREVVSRRLSALGVRPEEDITLAVAPRSECGALYQLERGGALRAFPAREASLC